MGETQTTVRRRRMRHPWPALAIAAGGAAVTIVSSLIARDGQVGPLERSIFEAINGLPDALYWPMWSFQLAGLLLTPLVVALAALVFRRWRLALAAVLLIPLKLWVEKGVLKELVHRERPGQTEIDPVLRDVPESGPSFPSGHAIIAFGLATLLTPYLSRRWLVVVWVVAVLNGVARIYLGAHNPLDVVAGAGAGVAIGGVLIFVIGVPARSPSRS